MKLRMKSLVSKLKHRWKLLTVISIVLALFGIFYYRTQSQNQVTVTFVRPERKNLVQTLEVSGVIDAKERARLRFVAGGKITYVGAKEGDAVKKWQTIATIDQATLKKQLEQDLNLYLKERWDWEETRDDVKDRALDTTEKRSVEKQQFDLENTVLDVEIRSIAINNYRLTAPFAGVLTVSPAAVPGVTVLATDYFEIVNPNTLIFRAAIDETDISKVNLDQTGQIRLDAYSDETIDSKVAYISFTSSESSSGTVFLVELAIPSSDLQKYRIGMNGDVAIKLAEREQVLAIPLISTRERDDKIYVDVKTAAGTTEEREITTGLETDDEVEVLSGVTESDEIVLPEQ
jgi:RND family efflux transporter MFP subunit